MSAASMWQWAVDNPALSLPLAAVVGFVLTDHRNPQQNVYSVSPPGNRHRQARNIRKAKAEGRAKERDRARSRSGGGR